MFFLPSFIIFLRLAFLYGAYMLRKRTNDTFHFCIANLGSSALWVAYGFSMSDAGLMYRSGTEVIILAVFTAYVLYRKRNEQLPRFSIIRRFATAPVHRE
jgi:hypothetical protein